MAIFHRHRAALLGIGILTGYLGAAPSIVWASGVVFAAAFFVMVPLAIWIYTLVFAFSSLWFAHYCLAALQQLRSETAAQEPALGDATSPGPAASVHVSGTSSAPSGVASPPAWGDADASHRGTSSSP